MILTYIIIKILTANMHQRMGENCIRHLEPIIHRPQRGTITDSTQEAVFV